MPNEKAAWDSGRIRTAEMPRSEGNEVFADSARAISAPGEADTGPDLELTRGWDGGTEGDDGAGEFVAGD